MANSHQRRTQKRAQQRATKERLWFILEHPLLASGAGAMVAIGIGAELAAAPNLSGLFYLAALALLVVVFIRADLFRVSPKTAWASLSLSTVFLLGLWIFIRPTPAPTIEEIRRAVTETSVRTRADISTVLVIESVKKKGVNYHLEITNGEIPVTITNVSIETPKLSHLEQGQYIPKSLRPRDSLMLSGDLIGTTITSEEPASVAMRVEYDAEINGVRKGFVSNYRFLVDRPQGPQKILPFSASHDDELYDTSRDALAARFEQPEGTMYMALPEKRVADGGVNIVTADNSNRRFVFNPATREVVFETKAQSARPLQVRLPLPETNHPQGIHIIVLLWTSNRAFLQVDDVRREVKDASNQHRPKGRALGFLGLPVTSPQRRNKFKAI